MDAMCMTRLDNFLEMLGSYSSHLVIECDGKKYTYLDLLEEIDRWHGRFCELEVKPGSVVGLCADYSLSSIAALISLLSRRAVVALVPRDRPWQLYVQDCHADTLLQVKTDGSFAWQRVACQTTHPLLDRM